MPSDKSKFDQVIVRMPKAEHAALKRAAEAEERSMSVVVRRALRRYLESDHGGSPVLTGP